MGNFTVQENGHSVSISEMLKAEVKKCRYLK